jgi:hypothetical protein
MTLRLQPQPRQQKRTRPYIAQEMEEKGLRFEIPYRRGHASDKDTKLHAQRLKVTFTLPTGPTARKILKTLLLES